MHFLTAAPCEASGVRLWAQSCDGRCVKVLRSSGPPPGSRWEPTPASPMALSQHQPARLHAVLQRRPACRSAGAPRRPRRERLCDDAYEVAPVQYLRVVGYRELAPKDRE